MNVVVTEHYREDDTIVSLTHSVTGPLMIRPSAIGTGMVEFTTYEGDEDGMRATVLLTLEELFHLARIWKDHLDKLRVEHSGSGDRG